LRAGCIDADHILRCRRWYSWVACVTGGWGLITRVADYRRHGACCGRPEVSYPSKNYCGKIVSVKVDKLSVSFDPELGDAVRSAAAEAGKPLSAWLAEAAASKLRAEALAQFLDGWEAEHGVLTADELARAEQELGMTASDSAA
jgi:hypothetical protein